MTPYALGRSAAEVYDYRSASSHTGFEAAGESHLFLLLDPTEPGAVSLFTIHGVDAGEGGPAQPRARVTQRFSGLPGGAFVAIADDRPEELEVVGPSEILGDWKFRDNTDGGVIGGLPWPGEYAVNVAMTIERGINSWSVLDPTQDPRDLDVGDDAILVVRERASTCRTDCTIPRCGDGITDAGEACDDGNVQAGDGCAPDCRVD